MNVEIRNGKVHISGYVNAVGRDSRPILTPTDGEFVEMIEPGTFREALTRAQNVDLLLNHDESRRLGRTSDGSITLREDNIGLHAEFDTGDAEVMEKAKRGSLRGWSFGMLVKKSDMEQRTENIPRRHVRGIDLLEVSLIDDRMQPCYAGTSVECRADGNVLSETRTVEDPGVLNDCTDETIEKWQKRVNELVFRGWQNRVDALNSGFE